jgi:hypothetical protein
VSLSLSLNQAHPVSFHKIDVFPVICQDFGDLCYRMSGWTDAWMSRSKAAYATSGADRNGAISSAGAHLRISNRRAEDDLFHFDRSRAPKPTDCDTSLASAKASARHWVVSMRPRWLVSLSQPLARPRSED